MSSQSCPNYIIVHTLFCTCNHKCLVFRQITVQLYFTYFPTQASSCGCLHLVILGTYELLYSTYIIRYCTLLNHLRWRGWFCRPTLVTPSGEIGNHRPEVATAPSNVNRLHLSVLETCCCWPAAVSNHAPKEEEGKEEEGQEEGRSRLFLITLLLRYLPAIALCRLNNHISAVYTSIHFVHITIRGMP